MEFLKKDNDEEILNKLKDLQYGQELIFHLDEDVINIISLLNFHLLSLDNLFKSYVREDNDTPNKEVLNHFIEEYTIKTIERENLIKKTLIKTLSYEGYVIFIKKRMRYLFEDVVTVLRITL